MFSRKVLACLCASVLSACGSSPKVSDQRFQSAPPGVVTPTATNPASSPTSPMTSPVPTSGSAPTSTSSATVSLPFATGINVAWVNFARDVGTGAPAVTELTNQFSQVAAAGGKVARLWLHTDGTLTPQFTNSVVTGPGTTTVADLKQILDAANAQGIQVMLTLWSFDMLRSSLKSVDASIVPRNRLLLTDAPSMQAYLDTALTPIVNAVKDHPALYAWDIINEPEGMTAGEGWTSVVDPSDNVTTVQIQTFINAISGRIHQLAPKNLTTAGATSFKYLSPTVGEGNNYTDKALIAAGGDPLGYLNFYQVHYYDSKGAAYSPFLQPASYFAVDKQVFVGEFYMQEYLDHGVTAPHLLYAKLQTLGYLGAMGWKDSSTPALNLMLNAMTYLQSPAELGNDPTLCSNFGGGFGTPFFDGSSLYRMQTAAATAQDPTTRCLVE